MSKIGKQPISIPENIQVKLASGSVMIKGPLGELSLKTHRALKLSWDEATRQIKVDRDNDSKFSKSLHGTTRTLIANMVKGAVEGFSKSLKIIGTGYRARLEGKDLILSVGHSHPVKVIPPAGLEFKLKGTDIITVFAADKQLVGRVAADIRRIRPPEPYKGKGIRYQNELVRKKQGKAVKAATA